MKRHRIALGLVAAAALMVLGARATSVPRGARAYVQEQAVLPAVTFGADSVRLDHVRQFRYGADTLAGYDSRAYALRDVRRVWYGLSPFASWRGPAHAFLSFEFRDSTYLSVSVEARKEIGETYSPLRGLLRKYELMYVIADEPDVVGLRAVAWGDPVYLFPTTATAAQAQALFRQVLTRAEQLRTRPEYYNTLVNNCATNLAAALNRMRRGRAPWRPALVLPGYSDTYAWRRGLLAIDEPPERSRERYRVRVPPDVTDAQFSRRIRTPIP